MMRIARQICIIQTIVDVDEFTWEERYGMFENNHWLHAVYGYSGALVIAIFYVFSIYRFPEILHNVLRIRMSLSVDTLLQ